MTKTMKCKGCGCTNAKLKYSIDESRIMECKRCKLMFVDPLPDDSALSQVYDESYFSNKRLVEKGSNHVYGYLDYIGERINKQRGYVNVCGNLANYLDTERNSPRLLDFGCGLGHFIDVAYDYGYDVQGVEYNPFAINFIRKRYQYNVQLSSEFSFSPSSLDVLTMFDVIEHLREPFQVFADARKALRKNGILVISTTDAKSFVSRLLGKRLEDFRRVREHLFFFSRKNLKKYLEDYGFSVLKVESLGHYFEVEQLCSRLWNIVPPLAYPLRLLTKTIRSIGKSTVHFNPRTKMIVYARKRN